MNGGSTNQSTTTQAPSFQQPYQQYGLNQALSQYQNTPQLVAPFSPQQEQAITGITNMAANGDPSVNAASNYVTSTLNGSPSSNPYLDSMFNQAAQQTQGQLASEFAGSGRNVDQSEGLRSQQLNQLATSIYGGAYNTGVQQQETAASLAPSLLQSNLGLNSALYGAGQNVQNLAQQYIQAPQNSLNQYMSRVNGNLGATSTFNPAFNAGAGALGGALTGLNLGSSIGNALGGSSGQDWGSILGALGGGLLGG
jgi:hypothetical protein